MAEEFDLPGLTGQLANVIRLLEVGFTKTNGRLDVIALQLQQAEQRHDALAKTEAEHHRQVMEILDEHETSINTLKTDLAQERTKASTAAEVAVAGARRFSTWVAIVVSVAGVVISNLDRILPG
ncbi:hypothetical protein ACGFJC_47215 [Nonomuraea fuscirosea]|uniref:hypothetical protein n=1 Tax=Nonomuraea fuscirosea TaxID=1291556 RepID=UPI00371E00FF